MPFLLAAALAGALGARDPVEDALRLAQKGESARAEEAAKAILRSPTAAPSERDAVDLIRGENLLTQALREGDPKRFGELIEGSIAHLEKFLRAQPASPHAPDARRGLDFRRAKRAERVGQAARSEADPKARAELIARAHDLHSSLQVHFDDRLRELRAQRPSPEVANEVADVRLDQARALLEHARLPGLEEERRRRILEDAVERLHDFQLDLCNHAVAFEAVAVEAQCHAELGDARTAEARLEVALSLRARLAEAKLEPNDYCLGTLRAAAVALADLHLKGGRLKEASAACDRALAEDPGLEAVEAGRVLKLLKAECLFQLDDPAAAEELAGEVLTADPDGRSGALARERMKAWAADPRGKRLEEGPERLLVRASERLEREDWRGALEPLKRCIESCQTSEDRERHVPWARYRMGLALSRLGRHGEAASAFEEVFEAFPRHELAPRALFEAARELKAEAAPAGAPEAEARRERSIARLKKDWPDHPAALSLPLLEAERLERERALARAAEAYLRVPEGAEARDSALAGAGRCLRQEAEARWEREERTAALREEVRALLGKAEEALGRLLEAAPPEGQGVEARRRREGLRHAAVQDLALVLCHEAVGRPEDGLKLLKEHAEGLRPEDPRRVRLGALEIRARLSMKDEGGAVEVLDALLDRFPAHPAVQGALLRSSLELAKLMEGDIAAGADVSASRDRAQKVHRYLAKWLNLGLARGQPPGYADAARAADALDLAARKLNGLDARAASFVDLHGDLLAKPEPYRDAAFLLTLLVEGKMGKVKEAEKPGLLSRLARSLGFAAREAGDFQRARARYAQVIQEARYVDSKGRIDLAAHAARPQLLPLYIELGAVYLELARRGERYQYDNALTVFQNVASVSEGGSEPWWIAKHLTARALYERGSGQDVRLARALLANLEKNYPDLDGGRFRLKERLLELKGKLAALGGGRKVGS